MKMTVPFPDLLSLSLPNPRFSYSFPNRNISSISIPGGAVSDGPDH